MRNILVLAIFIFSEASLAVVCEFGSFSENFQEALKKPRTGAQPGKYDSPSMLAAKEANVGNWTQARQQTKKVIAELEPKVKGQQLRGSNERNSREVGDLFDAYVENGQINDAVDLIHPHSLMDLGSELQSTRLPPVGRARDLAESNPIGAMNIYRRYYNSLRVRQEVYQRAADNGMGGAHSMVTSTRSQADEIKERMEELARSLP